MRFELRFDIFTVFMILGVFQGLFLAYLYFSEYRKSKKQNLFFALLLLTMVVINSELFLNYSGLIVKVIWIENYSEPFVFLLAPLLFMFIRSGLGEKYRREDWLHFFPFAIYFLYSFLYFAQGPEYKFNSYVYNYQNEWSSLPVIKHIPEDPLHLRHSLASLYLIQFFIYIVLIYQHLRKHSPAHHKKSILTQLEYRHLYYHWLHFVIITVLITFVKIYFARDHGDYIIGSYMSLLIYITSFYALKNVLTQKETGTPADLQKGKYEKSSLSEERKNDILGKLLDLFEKEKHFKSNIISLSSTADQISEQTHHVSQVINEKLNMTFFDMLAKYRVDEAKLILTQASSKQLTIEEIAEEVGYNSKAAFNKVFKKHTGFTPSEFRDQVQE